jgi:hypothetical protein
MNFKNNVLVLLTAFCGTIIYFKFSILVSETFKYARNFIEPDFLYREIQKKVKDTKFILLWNSYYGSKNWYHSDRDYYDEENLRKMQCPETQCFITNRRDYKHYYNFDALLFHMRPRSKMGVPKFRDERQFYIFGGVEPIGVRARDVNKLRNFFNLTG